jgi:non-ribosomal peptide synthetase component F
MQKLRFPDALSNAVRDASRTEGVTLFMLLMTALQVLLYRYSGQPDIRVGTLIANRNRAEIEDLIGLFVNTLVIRTALSEDMTYRQVLQQVRETVLGAFNNQDLPFELLMQEVERERELNRASLFEVLFILQNAPMQPLELTGLTVSSVEDGNSTEPVVTLTTFDLVLMMWEGPDGLTGSLRYKAELFHEATINRLLNDFQDILTTIAAQPAQTIAATPPPESV